MEGVLDAKGTLESLHAPKLPPGPVHGRLEALNGVALSEWAEPGGMIPRAV